MKRKQSRLCTEKPNLFTNSNCGIPHGQGSNGRHNGDILLDTDVYEMTNDIECYNNYAINDHRSITLGGSKVVVASKSCCLRQPNGPSASREDTI